MLNLVMTRWQNVDGPFLFQFVLFFFVTMEGRKEGRFWSMILMPAPALVSGISILDRNSRRPCGCSPAYFPIMFCNLLL